MPHMQMLPMGPGLIHVPWPRLLTLNMASTGMETEGVIALAVPWWQGWQGSSQMDQPDLPFLSFYIVPVWFEWSDSLPIFWVKQQVACKLTQTPFCLIFVCVVFPWYTYHSPAEDGLVNSQVSNLRDLDISENNISEIEAKSSRENLGFDHWNIGTFLYFFLKPIQWVRPVYMYIHVYIM